LTGVIRFYSQARGGLFFGPCTLMAFASVCRWISCWRL